MSNHTVSDLKLGDIERVIQTNISKKGTEANWFDDTYNVCESAGRYHNYI